LKPGSFRSADPISSERKNVAQDDGRGDTEEISLLNQSIKGDQGLPLNWLVLRPRVPSYRPRIRSTPKGIHSLLNENPGDPSQFIPDFTTHPDWHSTVPIAYAKPNPSVAQYACDEDPSKSYTLARISFLLLTFSSAILYVSRDIEEQRIRVNRLESDPFGNSGILLFLPNEDKKGHSHFWGEHGRSTISNLKMRH
jgi:hypothetical protein